jgi:hypothetical protein
MSNEIKNRVAASKLVTIDLEDFYPEGERILFDIKKWLFKEQILKEKEFRDYVKNHDWTSFQNKYVALTCSSEAIIPSWAYLLISVSLSPYTKKNVVGDLELLEVLIFQDIINEIDLYKYNNVPVIIKGCSNKSIPQSAYTYLISKLLPVVKSIMYGEACSNVPLFKKKL